MHIPLLSMPPMTQALGWSFAATLACIHFAFSAAWALAGLYVIREAVRLGRGGADTITCAHRSFIVRPRRLILIGVLMFIVAVLHLLTVGRIAG
ncbi:MAG: hypothetical protein ABIH41_05620 [Nanoarchaeota archaeon]